MTEKKLMGYLDPTTGELTDIRKRSYSEYNGNADLVDVASYPTVAGPLAYDAPSDSAVAPSTDLTLKQSGVPVTAVTVTADDIDTEVVDIEGPASAVVTISFNGVLPVSALSITLDASGGGSVTFGPTKLCNSTATKVKFKSDATTITKAVELDVKLG